MVLYRLAVISLAAAALGGGCVSNAPVSDHDASLGDRIEAALRRGVDEEGLSGAVAAVQVRDERHVFAEGTAVEVDDDLTVGTPFVVASVTKTYIAALALHLVDIGALDLDEPVNLDGVPVGVTLRHLLNHTSGLPAGHDEITSAAEFAADRRVAPPPLCGIAQCFHYGDLNYIAVGVLLQERTGQSLEALLGEFLDERGLDNTTFAGDGRLPRGTVARYDTGERDLEAGSDFARHTWAAGAMVSTVEDLLDWGRALFAGDVVAKETLAQMLDPTATMSLPCEGDERGCIGKYGLGVENRRVLGHAVVGHEGSTGAFLAHFPDDDVTIAILGSEAGAGRRLLARLAIATGIKEHADIWSSDLHGRDLRQLTDTPGIDGGPAWSPDGRSIVFGSTRDGQGEIYVMNSDGTNERRLTTDPAHDVAGRYSPDGSRIIFGSDRAGTFDIWTIAADGSDPRRLTTRPGDERLPSYSRDGRIVFEIGPDGDRDIAVMNGDGTDLVVHERPGDQFYASWSPDGERIAFAEPGAGISTMRADGTDASPVPHMRPSDRFPVWGPDGTLAFTGGEGDIWLTDIDGTGRRRVAITVEEEFGVWWSPDGSRLVFPSDR